MAQVNYTVDFMDGVWHEQDTTPSDIAAALQELLKQRHDEDEAVAPARVLNLVVIVDREWRGEVLNRLERVGRYHPSRLILCAVERGRTTIDAIATMRMEGDPKPGELALYHEEVLVDVGERHLQKMDTIVDPLVVSDLATVVWSPHGHPQAVDSLMRIVQVVLTDSEMEPDPAAAAARATQLEERSYVVDLGAERGLDGDPREAGRGQCGVGLELELHVLAPAVAAAVQPAVVGHHVARLPAEPRGEPAAEQQAGHDRVGTVAHGH